MVNLVLKKGLAIDTLPENHLNLPSPELCIRYLPPFKFSPKFLK